MHRVAAGEHRPRYEHDVADFQRSHRVGRQRRLQRHLSTGPREPGLIEHGNNRVRRIAVQPLVDCAGRRIQHDAQPPERPAIVRHRHEKTRGQSIERRDLASDQRHLAAESHGADVQIVHR